MRYRLSLAIGCAALGGCTTLEVNRFSGDTDDRRGIAYFLPFTQFETEIVWSARCDKATNELGITPKVEVTPKTAPDPSGLYVIDYRSLSAFTKTSNVKVEFFDSGAIKSINASADDKTGEFVASSLVAAGKVANAVFFGSSGVTECSTKLREALTAVGQQKQLVDAKAASLKKATGDLETLTARMTRLGSSVTDGMREQYNRQMGEVIALQMELDALTRELTERQKPVIFKSKITFPQVSNQSRSLEGEAIDPQALKKWLSEKDAPKAGQISKDFAIWLELDTPSGFAALWGDDTGAPKDGIRYRVAIPGTLRVCRAALCSNARSAPSVSNAGEPDIGTSTDPMPVAVKDFPVKILQQGSTFFLPFESEAFTNGALTATFSEAGVLTSAGYEQKRAQGEALASLGGTLADQITGLLEASREDDKSDLELLQEKIALQNAENELAKAEEAEQDASQIDQEIEALAADTSLKLAQVANKNADIALKEAEKKLAESGN